MKIFTFFTGKTILIGIFILAICGISSAEVLTLDQSVNLALKNNYGLIAAHNSYDASQGNLYAAWGTLAPTLTASALGAKNWAGFERTDPITGQPTSGAQTTVGYTGSLALQQSYPGLGIGTYAALRRSYHDKNSFYYAYSSARSSLIQSVKSSYYSALRSKMLVAVDSEAVKRSDERLRVTQSRYDLGSAAMSDVLRAKVQLATDQLSLVSDANAYLSALANLAYIIGVSVTQPFDITDRLPEVKSDVSFEGALAEALTQNPDYRKAQFDYYSSKDAALSAYSNNLPSLSLSLSHGTSVPSAGQLFDFKKSHASYSFRAGLTFNIFNGFSDYANARAANDRSKTANENLKNTKNSVALFIRQAFLDIQKADQERQLSDQSVASAQEDYNLVKEKYDLGAAAILDLLDAEVALKQAQISQVQALFDYNLAVANLDRAMGK